MQRTSAHIGWREGKDADGWWCSGCSVSLLFKKKQSKWMGGIVTYMPPIPSAVADGSTPSESQANVTGSRAAQNSQELQHIV